MTVTAELIVRCEAEVAGARERLRIEVRALGLPEAGVAGIALMRAIADHPRLTFPMLAKMHGYGVSSYTKQWYTAPMPSLVFLRDHVRAHLLASILQHRAITGSRAALEMGEQSAGALQRAVERASGDALGEWRRTHTVGSTLADWRVFLIDHRDGLEAFVSPTVTARPDVTAQRRAVELAAHRLECLRAELALMEAA